MAPGVFRVFPPLTTAEVVIAASRPWMLSFQRSWAMSWRRDSRNLIAYPSFSLISVALYIGQVPSDAHDVIGHLPQLLLSIGHGGFSIRSHLRGNGCDGLGRPVPGHLIGPPYVAPILAGGSPFIVWESCPGLTSFCVVQLLIMFFSDTNGIHSQARMQREMSTVTSVATSPTTTTFRICHKLVIAHRQSSTTIGE